MFQSITDRVLADVRLNASAYKFPPSQVLKCNGEPIFRSQQARNLACLFDLSPDVICWTCLPLLVQFGDGCHTPDFAVQRPDGDFLVDVQTPPEWVVKAAESDGWLYDCTTYRLDDNHALIANAVDLLPYAHYSMVSLADRLRVLSALDDVGPLALKHCVQLIRNSSEPMAAITALYFSGEIKFDLSERINPDTRVSRN
ncbi:hypothetical protein [Ochrobactrum chromiisoli]|uniref:Uncharacterized protein n=1 Tax=Ochrobactrum chromiisoli TaxID=2993941 RepID=A0ABT3QSR0_9HYPH|nr:hypothetical protein [Ochrobactrum chromiisoli]MCX2698597.1 hypothetical protein [Ochrobactrum chromiisoli]